MGYQVRVKGCLSEDFLAWVDLSGSYDPQPDETVLSMSTTDQATLYGLLNRLRDLGITLISVESQPVQDSKSQLQRE
jgi:prephenate dehydratase